MHGLELYAKQGKNWTTMYVSNFISSFRNLCLFIFVRFVANGGRRMVRDGIEIGALKRKHTNHGVVRCVYIELDVCMTEPMDRWIDGWMDTCLLINNECVDFMFHV